MQLITFTLAAIICTITAIPTVDLKYRRQSPTPGPGGPPGYGGQYGPDDESSGGCTPNTIFCNTHHTFSLCVPSLGVNATREVYFGSVAAGTYCDEIQGRIRADNYGNCEPDGQLFCGPEGYTFFLCDQGGLINMGSVAPGTRCYNGSPVATY